MDSRRETILAITVCLVLHQCLFVTCSVIPDDEWHQWSLNHTIVKRQGISALTGGELAQIGQFPWMAVVHRLVGGGRISMCGGTILSKRWVLTAGHCVSDSPRKFFVVFGEIDKNKIGYDFYQGSGVSMMTTKGALHPQYSQTVNDIGLLYMPRDIRFGGAIQPIRLAGRDYQDETFNRRTATIVGWGKDGPASTGSKHLKYGQIQIIANSQCARTWGVGDSVVCTESGSGTDACQGDSGGPLIVRGNNEWLQVGIVSYGDADCPSSRPGVFTRVTSFLKWIKEVTGIQY